MQMSKLRNALEVAALMLLWSVIFAAACPVVGFIGHCAWRLVLRGWNLA